MVIQKEWKGNKAGCGLDLEGGGGLGGAVRLVDYSIVIVTVLTEPRKEKARNTREPELALPSRYC